MKEIALYTLDIAQNSITAQAKRLDITLTEEGETITLSIRDDGTGMAPELLARVSDPFTTTRTTRAMGLGDRKSTRLNSSHITRSRMPSSA